MKNNLFLTGPSGVGKTSLLCNVIKEKEIIPAGFMVKRKGTRLNPLAFHLIPAAQYIAKEGEVIPPPHSCFAHREDENYCWEIDNQVFNGLGVRLLYQPDQAPLVIMDELGRFEKKAYRFLGRVLDSLADPVPVLGVIKDEKTPFLDGVRSRPDITLVRVREDNQVKISRLIGDWLEENLSQRRD